MQASRRFVGQGGGRLPARANDHAAYAEGGPWPGPVVRRGLPVLIQATFEDA